MLTRAEEEAVAFASDLIRIDTSNRGGGDCRERPAAEYVAERLAGAGLDQVLLESAPGRANVVARIGIRPRRDIVLAFTADEEDTAAYGAQWLVDNHPGLFEGCTEAIGESGGFTFHAGNVRLYPLASAERGTAWLKLTAHGQAGHGSKLNPANAVARLADAVARIAAYRWPVRLIPTVQAAISGIADAVGAAAGQPEPGGEERWVARLLPRHGRQAVLPAGHRRVRVHPAAAAARLRLLRHVPRGGRAGPGLRAALRRPGDDPPPGIRLTVIPADRLADQNMTALSEGDEILGRLGAIVLARWWPGPGQVTVRPGWLPGQSQQPDSGAR